jgi:alkanesulfonate monooxygenase SsuD/methylene tetrahydromethanopterin reductase-like flavin-dependent oxidoreductase (luciferase family)
MRFGAGLWCLQSTATAPRHPARAYEELLEDAVLLEQLGYETMWLSEHHFFYDGYCSSPITAASGILAATEQLTVATGMSLAAMRDPARLGRDCAALADRSGGRFELGLGLGYRDVEFDGKGVNRRERVGRRKAAMRAVRAAAPDLPIWLGSALPEAVARAGEHGHGVLYSGANPLSLIRDLSTAHREGFAASGRQEPRPPAAALRNVWVTDDPAERRAVMDWFRASYVLYAGLGWSVPQRGETAAMDFTREVDRALDDAVATAIVGSADEVAEGLQEVVETGVDEIVFRVVIEGAPQQAVHEVLHRLAGEVLPQLRDRVGVAT